jgi:hypothetical protein
LEFYGLVREFSDEAPGPQLYKKLRKINGPGARRQYIPYYYVLFSADRPETPYCRGLGYGEFFRRVLIFYALFDDVETPIAYISRS